MPIQQIPNRFPCLKATDTRSLGFGVTVGDQRTPGAVIDGTDVIEDARYVVSGTGTITYAGTTYAVGRTFLGVQGQTSFTRSANTALLIKVKNSAVVASAINVADYIVSGTADDSLSYPFVGGNDYSPGDMFRGMTGVQFATSDQSTLVYEIDDNPLITSALAVHHFGSVTFPNTLDYSFARQPSNAAAINAVGLNVVLIWNLGSSAATVIVKAYNSTLETATGAIRSDALIELPTGGSPYVWWPTEPYRQGAEGNSFGSSVEDRRLTENSFVFQTASADIWLVPLLNTTAGFQ